jgi:hypothetical protein
VALGQGVFRLDTSLSAVPGSRIRAWNGESLRGVVAPSVSSAHTLQIAIPRRELGGLRRGQTVRVAAGVGLDLGAGAVARKFDAGFMGSKGPMAASESPMFFGVPISMPEAPPIQLEVARESEGRIRIRWAAQAGQRYRLEAAGQLLSPFALVLEMEALPQDGTSEVSVVTGPVQLFFRIR